MWQFIVTDLKNNIKLSIAYSIILVLLTSIEYVFFELVNYPDVLYFGGAMFNFMTLIVILLLFAMTFYLNTFYIEEKRKQIVFLSLSGSTLGKLGLFLLVEYFLMVVVSMVISFILGKVMFIFIIRYASQVVAIPFNIQFSPTALVEMVGIEISKCLLMVMLNISFIYKNELADIINKTDKKQKKYVPGGFKKSVSTVGASMGAGMSMMRNDDLINAKSREDVAEIMKKQVEINKELTKKMASAPVIEKVEEDPIQEKKYRFYLPMILYVVGLIGILISNDPMICCVLILIIGLSLVTFLRTRVGRLFDSLEQSRLYKNPYDYVAFQEIYHRLSSNQMILLVMNMALPFFIFEATTRATLFVQILACFSFIVLLIVLMVLLLLKNILDVQHGISNYRILYVVGYHKDDLIKISKKANAWYYFISVGLSLFGICVFAIKMLHSTMGLCLLILSVSILLYVLSVVVISYYNKLVIRGIE